ncbi:alpha/beta fold hydrolase [Breoghania sp. L-A4]|uniref:alpha/beta hydrolase n=1 Tax=Breoghania sp. L-A4 TaxID=2304600 RepID=UPI0032049E95
MTAVEARAIRFTGATGNRIAGDVRGPEGDAPVVLLVHGGGQTRHSWESTAEQLAELGMTAITIDQRGHGDSDWLADGRYHFADYAADLVAVARAIAEKFGARPVAIGASLGASPRRSRKVMRRASCARSCSSTWCRAWTRKG